MPTGIHVFLIEIPPYPIHTPPLLYVPTSYLFLFIINYLLNPLSLNHPLFLFIETKGMFFITNFAYELANISIDPKVSRNKQK